MIQQYRAATAAHCCWITTARWCRLPPSRGWRGRTRNCWNCSPLWAPIRPIEVTIISGRPRRTLEDWFGKLPISLIAEHGVWLRNKNADWHMLKTMTTTGRSACARFSSFSWTACRARCWRKRNFRSRGITAAPTRNRLRSAPRNCSTTSPGYTRNIDVQVFEGNKVIEVRNSGINKGTAALEWLTGQTPEFILGIGDDWTDEDLFRALPPTAFSVRVGVANTAARYYLSGPATVRKLLHELSQGPREKIVTAG